MTTATERPKSTLLAPPTPLPIAPPLAALAARVSFRQPVTSAPHVDAAWWPRSRDLEAELPALLDVLWTAARDVNRVSYAIDSWLPAPRRLDIGGRQVRLGGFAHQDPSMISLRDAWGAERIDILVIPPEAEPDLAAAAMERASRSGPNERATRMLELAAAAVAGRS
ncbi:MAG TPA: DUF5994 family protein [Jatrophihabitans sp.]|jgi:hypothetical protein